MKLNLNDAARVAAYDEFVATSPFGNMYQDRAWSVVKSNWGSDYFYIEEQGEIIAALSVLSIHDGRAGKKLFYAPRGPVCDLHRIDLVKALIDEAAAYAKANDGFVLRIDPEVACDEALEALYAQNGLPFRRDPKTCSQPPMSLILELRGRNADQVLADFSKNTRKRVRHSYKLGLETVEGGREDLDVFYDLIVKMSLRQGISYRPKAYFEHLLDAFGDRVRLSFTKLGEDILSGSMLIGYGRRCVSLYGGSIVDRGNFDQNYQINFEEIRYAADNGFDCYDMGGIYSIDEDDGLYTFKRKFTEDNVMRWIGEIDVVIDEQSYGVFINHENLHTAHAGGRGNQ